MYKKGVIGILYLIAIPCFGAQTYFEKEKAFVETLVTLIDVIKKMQNGNGSAKLTEAWGRKYHNLGLCDCTRVGETNTFRNEIPLQQFSVKTIAYWRDNPQRIDREYRVPNGDKMACIQLNPNINNPSEVRVRVAEENKNP